MIVSRQSPEKIHEMLVGTRLAVKLAKVIDTNKQCNQK